MKKFHLNNDAKRPQSLQSRHSDQFLHLHTQKCCPQINVIPKTFDEKVIQIYIQFQSDRASFQCIQQVLQLLHDELKIVANNISGNQIVDSLSRIILKSMKFWKITSVNWIRYSSALEMRQSHNITAIPATTSKKTVQIYMLEGDRNKIRYEISPNPQRNNGLDFWATGWEM